MLLICFVGIGKRPSKLTKTEILSGHIQEARIYHNNKWYAKVSKLIARLSQEVA